MTQEAPKNQTDDPIEVRLTVGRVRPITSCFTGCMTFILTGAILLGLGAAVLAVFAPNILTSVFSRVMGYDAIQSRPVQGNPANYDPITAYASLQAFAGEGTQLIDLEAQFVRADGTLDLTASYSPGPRVIARFALEVPPPADAPPVGAGNLGTWYRRVTILAYRPGQKGRSSSSGPGFGVSYTYVNEGMTRVIDNPATATLDFLPAPTCAFADLWQVALERGAPANAVATIKYDVKGYDFDISDLDFRIEFDHTCQVRT